MYVQRVSRYKSQKEIKKRGSKGGSAERVTEIERSTLAPTVYMLRPNSQPLTSFETGRPSTRFEAGARVFSTSFDRTILPRPFFTRVLDRSVSCYSEVLRAMAFSLRSHTLLESV